MRCSPGGRHSDARPQLLRPAERPSFWTTPGTRWNGRFPGEILPMFHTCQRQHRLDFAAYFTWRGLRPQPMRLKGITGSNFLQKSEEVMDKDSIHRQACAWKPTGRRPFTGWSSICGHQSPQCHLRVYKLTHRSVYSCGALTRHRVWMPYP